MSIPSGNQAWVSSWVLKYWNSRHQLNHSATTSGSLFHQIFCHVHKKVQNDFNISKNINGQLSRLGTTRGCDVRFSPLETTFFHLIFNTICAYLPLVAGRPPDGKQDPDPKTFRCSESFMACDTKNHCEVIGHVEVLVFTNSFIGKV